MIHFLLDEIKTRLKKITSSTPQKYFKEKLNICICGNLFF